MRQAECAENVVRQNGFVYQDAVASFMNPGSYEGLFGFHKYWGKKPIEALRLVVKILSTRGGRVCDPFLGSGLIARETVDLERHFIGGDLNPFAVKLSKFLCYPCDKDSYEQEFKRIKKELQLDIDESYGFGENGGVSHLLWEGDSISQVWERPAGKRKRIERAPTEQDYALFEKYKLYKDINTRPLSLFDNARINTHTSIAWDDLFTGRAMRNIRLLRDSISRSSPSVRDALELTLTASIGQMSKMVFAITSRGKSVGKTSSKIEVGSWVVGYWRPKTHFEINVWNCFESKASKLLKGLPDVPVLDGDFSPDVRHLDACELLSQIEDDSLELVITDPPHGDRIPYLELSELWNATLNLESNLESEIVVSNAKGRGKNTSQYDQRMTRFFSEAAVKLKKGGCIALFFNSRKNAEWEFIRTACESANVNFVGAFPMHYSASSVVQDNREGSMKSDYVIIFCKGLLDSRKLEQLESLPGWLRSIPSFGDQK